MRHARRLALLLVLLCAVAFAAERVTPAELAKNPTKFDDKVVTVVGPVSEFRQRTSQRGNEYFTFKIKVDKDQELNIYGRGKVEPAVKNGDRVEVTGQFRKEKKVQDFTVKNEIDVTAPREGSRKPDEPKFGVKILPSK
jgi:DNA/RNA endonuclease YhcR with UshA esterase domain